MLSVGFMTSAANAAPASNSQSFSVGPQYVFYDGISQGMQIGTVHIAPTLVKGLAKTGLSVNVDLTFSSSQDILLTDAFPGGDAGNLFYAELDPGYYVPSLPGSTSSLQHFYFGDTLETIGSTDSSGNIQFNFSLPLGIDPTSDLFTLNIFSEATDLGGVPLVSALDDVTVSGWVTVSGTVPEPASLALLSLGGLALVAARRGR